MEYLASGASTASHIFLCTRGLEAAVSHTGMSRPYLIALILTCESSCSLRLLH